MGAPHDPVIERAVPPFYRRRRRVLGATGSESPGAALGGVGAHATEPEKTPR